MNFDEWLRSEHMRTLVHIRLKEIDEVQPAYTDHGALILQEGRRREIRALENWQPEKPEEVKKVQETNVKAGQYFRTNR